MSSSSYPNRDSSLTIKSFASIFNDKEENIPLLAKQAIQKANFKYKILDGKEYEQVILNIIKTLDSETLKASGPHRLNDWEAGWGEHLQEFNQKNFNLNQLIAKWGTRGTYIRLQGQLIKPESDSFENDFVTVLRCYLFNKYYKDINTFYEFGAGTGLNLVAASEIFPKMKLVGLDWANSSIEIINSLKRRLKINISGKRMDLFHPDGKYILDEKSAVFTVGTLEQLGENFKPFIDYLLKNKPKVCIHLETLYEIYDQNNLLDYLAVKYLEQRNYLKGFLPFLEKLEEEKKIEILEIRRTFGSLYHEGYTYTVWQPI